MPGSGGFTVEGGGPSEVGDVDDTAPPPGTPTGPSIVHYRPRRASLVDVHHAQPAPKRGARVGRYRAAFAIFVNNDAW